MTNSPRQSTTAIDTTIVVLALPQIQRSLHIGLASVIWVIVGYLFVITVLSTRPTSQGVMVFAKLAPPTEVDEASPAISN